MLFNSLYLRKTLQKSLIAGVVILTAGCAVSDPVTTPDPCAAVAAHTDTRATVQALAQITDRICFVGSRPGRPHTRLTGAAQSVSQIITSGGTTWVVQSGSTFTVFTR